MIGKQEIVYKFYLLTLDYRYLHMKVKASIKADASKGDQLVRRRGRLYVINKKDPTASSGRRACT